MHSSISRTIMLGAASLALAAGLVACGSSSNSSTTSSASEPTTPPAASVKPVKNAEVIVTDNPDLGKILTSADGKTLYKWEGDTGTTSSCNGDCAVAWTPYETDGAPKASKGADASLLGTSKRDDGTTQVTYNGHPLYHYAEDTSPGDINGENSDEFGAEWYAVTPTGDNAEPATSGATSTTDSSSSSSY